MAESIEHIRSGREVLLGLEAEGEYVFHGSENPDLDTLEPRQAYDYRDGVRIPDGSPAVFASTMADYAILMALINKKNCPKGYRSSAGTQSNEKGEVQLSLHATREAVDQLNENSSGYVYVFDKDLFQQKNQAGVEYTSTTPVVPVNKVLVTGLDLPPNVEIF